MTIETYGDRYVVLKGEAIVGIYKTLKQALDVAHAWNYKLWSWDSLLDLEMEKNNGTDKR